MGCIDKLKDSFPEIHNYLRGKAGIDFDPKTGTGKEEWIKAAKDLQDHTLDTLHNVYNQIDLPGYEKQLKIENENKKEGEVTKDEVSVTPAQGSIADKGTDTNIQATEEKQSSVSDNNLNQNTNEKNNTADGRTAGQTNQGSTDNIQKPEKEKGIFERAKNVTATDPYDRVLQHFSDGGKIDNSVVESLFGNNNKSTNEQRKSMLGFIKKGGQTIDQLAHSLWESDQNENHTTQDYKEAIEAALSEHTSPASMAKELVSRNDPDEVYKKFLNDRFGEDLGSKENVLDAVNIVEGMSVDEINHLLSLESDENKQQELDDFISKKHESVAIESDNNDNSGTGGKPPEGDGQKKEEPESERVTNIRKANQLEIKKVADAYEKQKRKSFSETVVNGLAKIIKANPAKSVYDAALSTLSDLVHNNYGDLTRDEAAGVMLYLKHETGAKRSELAADINSNDLTVRQSALLQDAPLKDVYDNASLMAKNITTEAGRTLVFTQADMFDDEHGLQVRRMDLLRASGGEKLSPEDEKFVKDKWEEEKAIQQKIQETREASMQENFNKEIEKLHKEYADKLKSKGAKVTDKTTREKTLKQKGDEWADKILRAKIKTDPNTLQSNILGLLPAAYNALLDGIAATVRGGSTIAQAIKEAIESKNYPNITEDDLTNHLVEIANKKTTGETLQSIKNYVKDTGDTDVTKEMVGKNLIKDFVDSHIGEHDQKDILDKAAKDLKEVFPDIDKKKLIEAYLKEGEFKQDTKKRLESFIKDQQDELKKIAKSELTADQQQKILLDKKKDLAEKKIKEFQKKIDKEDYAEPEATKTLNKQDAELIRLQKEQSKVEEQFRKKQHELREANKSTLERLADLGRSAYVAFLIGSPKTLLKVATLALLRPASEIATKSTLGKIFDTFFPGISKSALRGGESSSFRSTKLGMEAYFKQMGDKAMEKKAAKSEAAFQKADKEYKDYKDVVDNIKKVRPDSKELEIANKKLGKIKKERDERLFNTMGNLVYQFIGGSSLKDSWQAFVNRSNEIEKQFGKVEGESFKEGNVLDKVNYVMGFIGRSHSALKTFSGRYSFASGFMARLEGAVNDGVELTSDKVLEIAHESYLDWERGKYQQSNVITDLWNKVVNSVDKGTKGTDLETGAAIGKAFLKTEVAITRVPVNIIHEAVMEYTFGAFRVAGLFNDKASVPKLLNKFKGELKDEGLLKGSKEFREALAEKISQMDDKQAALIARNFRKGGLGVGLYALTLILGGIHFGIFPHMGQKKKKDESQLGKDELNPGQIMFGDTKLGETASATIEHIPALWTTFMGLGMAQEYHDQIKKGKTTPAAVGNAIYTHLQIIEGNIPQTKLVDPLKIAGDVTHIVKTRLTDMGLINKSLPQGWESKDAKDPTLKYFFDKGVDFTPFNPSKIEIPKKGKLSELPQEKWEEYNTEKKKVLKRELLDLKNETFYVTPDDKVHTEEPDEGKYSIKRLGQLTVQQLKKVIVPAETKATEAAKEKLSREK